MNHAQNTLVAASLGLCLTMAGGCRSWFAPSTGDPKQASVRLEDFVGDTRPAPPEDPERITLVATDVPEETADDTTDQTPPTTRSEDALAINAMVGHINGEAVYADQIFDVNLIAQLESFGRRFSDKDFFEQAEIVIRERLGGVVINKLILGEAERNLTDRQRQGIEAYVQARREELIRFYGEGALSVAKARFREDRGVELDQFLVAFREEQSIGSYIRSKVLPKIVVNQRDIERYYEDHKDHFQRPDQRVFRIIRVSDTKTADLVKRRLGRGEAFEDVASDPTANQYNPSGGGMFNDGQPLSGKNIYGIKPVNDALLSLDQSEHAGPIAAGKHLYFVQLVEFEPGVTVSLNDAQIDIEQKLRAIQFEQHALRFRRDLMARGSYTDEGEMLSKLLEIAYARYYR